MLPLASVETATYRALSETSDYSFVVGRRGTGKSALFQRLGAYYGTAPHTLSSSMALTRAGSRMPFPPQPHIEIAQHGPGLDFEEAARRGMPSYGRAPFEGGPGTNA
jgi:hypothetical protein